MDPKRAPGVAADSAAGLGLAVPMLALVTGLADALELVSKKLVDHHLQVARIAWFLTTEMKIAENDRDDLIWASLLHDCGGISEFERLQALSFEMEMPSRHAEIGYMLISRFGPLQRAAEIIRYHHLWWQEGRGARQNGEDVPICSPILHLADRVAVLIPGREEVLSRADAITKRIIGCTGDIFHPKVTDAFTRVASRESFWLDVVEPRRTVSFNQGLTLNRLDLDDIEQLAQIFGQIIDFRCPFTASHSASVAAVAAALAAKAGFSPTECRMMRIAGLLHDLGKLAVSTEILEKPGPLDREEFFKVKSHPFYTYRILAGIPGLQVINEWASQHHEHLDGSGYPFHLKAEQLSTGARIMAVADTFTALNEDRPYRAGMEPDAVGAIQQNMGRHHHLDSELVELLRGCLHEICAVRQAACETSGLDYSEFRSRANAPT